MMYSQNDEELFITEFFAGRTGLLLDIGAYDGISMSNSRKLLESGWSGVLVEPKWSNFTQLCRNSAIFAEKVKLVCAAVSDNQELHQFWVDEAPQREWSTTMNRGLLTEGYILQPSPVQTWVASTTMDHLWNEFGAFDFITLDAEGEDMRILISSTRWDSAQLICIETHNSSERDKMKKCFARIGFKTVYETRENLLVSNATPPQP